MMYDLPTHAMFGDVGDCLEDVEAVNLICCSNSSYNDEEIETYTTTMGSSRLDRGLPSIFEPNPIDPKSAVIVDTFRPPNTTWYTTDDTTTTRKLFDDIIRGLRTLVDTSSSNKEEVVTGYQECGRLLVPEAPKTPKRDLDTCAIGHPFSPRSKRAKTSSRTRRSEVDNTTTCTGDVTTLRNSHIEQWDKRFSELVEYQKQYGHCLVPLNWQPNPALAHWVKRQRYQYRIKIEGKHSSMTPERLEALQQLGFTWDSHSVAWLERLQELSDFKQRYGHPNVPKQYPEHSQLAIWVKCQRRQYKLHAAGQKSNMTPDRIERLNILGFVFNPRSVKAPSLHNIEVRSKVS